eukprot:TRINITY_DN13733_c0_g1_i1.p1 TRINITY_DN13733_c0_g1~~TRINITY_DN13733_c0_g1_i1.p1  ORF type:complete len:230 (-),score=55.24 TRINITY_DN13733_c0_g1_i1:63-752(-)
MMSWRKLLYVTTLLVSFTVIRAASPEAAENGIFGMVSSFFSSLASSGSAEDTKVAKHEEVTENVAEVAKSESESVKKSPSPPSKVLETEEPEKVEEPKESMAESGTCSSPGSCAGTEAQPPSPAEAEAALDCNSSPVQDNVEPVDTLVKHTPGSACCAPQPQKETTDRLGCCQRCLASETCQVYVFQPSAGTCWLLRWQGSGRTLAAAMDRIMGDRPGLPSSADAKIVR